MNRTSIASLLTFTLAFPALAGPITPPPGPVASTHKTLTEVEPRIAINATNTPGTTQILFRITSPGSYLLTSNIVVPSGKTGVEIASSNVTLDLNGFMIRGSGPETIAIRSPVGATLSHIRLRNGIITEAGQAIRLDAEACDVRDITVERATGGGGILVQTGCVSDCRVMVSAGPGIEILGSGVVRNCATQGTASDGIKVGPHSLVESCATDGNANAGIRAGDSSRIAGCVSISNTSSGIVVGSLSSVTDCVLAHTGGTSISLGSGSSVSDCQVSGSLVGVLASNDADILRNSCLSNTTGIQITGSRCRVEDNSCTGGNKGILVTGTGNIISRNVCSLNVVSNWDIAGGNKCLVVVGINAALISGDSGGTGPGSTHPLANYTN